MVAMMLRWLPEDITVHNEDLEGLENVPFSMHVNDDYQFFLEISGLYEASWN